MTIRIQERMIRWIFSPLSKLVAPIGDRTRGVIISICVLLQTGCFFERGRSEGTFL